MIQEKISSKERSRFVKRKIVKTEINWKNILHNILKNSISLGIDITETNLPTKIYYWDDGTYSEYSSSLGIPWFEESGIYNESLYKKRLKEEKELFEKTGNIIKDKDIDKREKNVVFEDGCYPTITSGFTTDKFSYFRNSNFRRTLENLENSKLVKLLRDPKVKSVTFDEGTGRTTANYKN